MVIRSCLKSKIPFLASTILQTLTIIPLKDSSFIINQSTPKIHQITEFNLSSCRQYHDGRPRGPLWRGKKIIGKEALFVILGLKRFKNDEEKLKKFVKSHVLRLLKMDMIAVLTELERQEEVSLCLKGLEHLLCGCVLKSLLAR